MTQRPPEVPLGSVLRRAENWINLDAEQTYTEVTVRLWGKGVVPRRSATGSEIAAPRRLRVASGQFIMSRIDARNGALGIVPGELDGAVVSNDFPVFEVVPSRLDVRYLSCLARTEAFVDLCRAASEGSTNRVRLKEERFLAMTIPLPGLEEQRRIVGWIEAVTTRVAEARQLRRETQVDSHWLLAATFREIAKNAPRIAFGEVAPLNRRPVRIEAGRTYPQIAVRSFGKGVFAKPPLRSDEITWQKPFLVRTGDILISNIKAWEGAIAVAGAGDDGRVASHRYLTFTPLPNVATARFLCFFLLTREGLEAVGRASPGSADRNRTLSAKVLQQTRVPVPSIDKQVWFDQLIDKVSDWRYAIDDVDHVLDAIMPSVLRRAFLGRL